MFVNSEMDSGVCIRDSSASPPSSLIAPIAVKPNLLTDSHPQLLSHSVAAAAVEQQRFQQLYQIALAERIRIASGLAWPRTQSHYETVTTSPHLLPPPGLTSPQSMLTAGHPYMYPWRFVDPRSFYRVPEEPKPQHSYIGLIAMAILSSPDRKLVLSDIYNYILEHYAYFRSRGPGWRNSIRHNLSLNDCFIKSGRSANGKGHYWAIHPANLDDFIRGDFRRRRAQRRVRKHLGLQVDDDSSPEPPSISPTPLDNLEDTRRRFEVSNDDAVCHAPTSLLLPASASTPTVARKRQFDVASLLAPDDQSRNSIVKARRCIDTLTSAESTHRLPVTSSSERLTQESHSSSIIEETPTESMDDRRNWSIIGWAQGHPWTLLTPPEEDRDEQNRSPISMTKTFQSVTGLRLKTEP